MFAHLRFYFGAVASYRSMVWSVESLVEAGLIEERRTRPGPTARFRSTIRATPELVGRVPIKHVRQLLRLVDEPIRLKDGGGRLARYDRTFETELCKHPANTAGQAAFQFQGSRSSMRLAGWSWMCARTSASHARASTSLSLQVSMRV